MVGADKRAATARTLADQPEAAWENTGAREKLGWSASGVCVCWLHCEEWPRKRLLIGRRFKRQGEMIWNYAGMMTDLDDKDVALMRERGLSFARPIWRLHDAKAGMETLLSDGLSDLGRHHPPCGEYVRNAGFYAAAALAWTLASAVDAVGGADERRGSLMRNDGGERARPMPGRMRLWRLRRQAFALPARIVRHARELKAQLLGVGEDTRKLFEHYRGNLGRCRAIGEDADAIDGMKTAEKREEKHVRGAMIFASWRAVCAAIAQQPRSFAHERARSQPPPLRRDATFV